jgi:hypothetical protein
MGTWSDDGDGPAAEGSAAVIPVGVRSVEHPYHDRSGDSFHHHPPPGSSDENYSNSRMPFGISSTLPLTTPMAKAEHAANHTFPLRLYDMLLAAEKSNQTEIVAWQPHGRYVIGTQRCYCSDEILHQLTNFFLLVGTPMLLLSPRFTAGVLSVSKKSLTTLNNAGSTSPCPSHDESLCLLLSVHQQKQFAEQLLPA